MLSLQKFENLINKLRLYRLSGIDLALPNRIPGYTSGSRNSIWLRQIDSRTTLRSATLVASYAGAYDTS